MGLVLAYVVGACLVSCGLGICIGKAIHRLRGDDEPLYPQRVRLVKKAQQEIAWHKAQGRQP